MAPQPEQQAREKIDQLLTAAGWHVCDAAAANIHAARGVAIREFPLQYPSPSPGGRGLGGGGYGFADYLLYVDGKAAGVIEAKKEGVTLTGVETQSDKYTKGLPDDLQSATPDVKAKDHFVIVDAVGVCEQDVRAKTKIANPVDERFCA